MPFGDLTAVSVDDSKECLCVLEELARMIGLKVRSFLSPLDALHYVEGNQVDMIFTDFCMPQMDGITFIREVRKLLHDIPIIMVTAEPNVQKLKELFPAGSTVEFLFKPFSAVNFFEKVKPPALLRQYINFMSAYRLKGDNFGRHRNRVGHYAKIIADGLNFDEPDLIYHAAQFHDIGMISISDDILLKGDKLTASEMELVKKHTIIGYNMMRGKVNPYFSTTATISLTHHETFDGTGYPAGLSGDSIPVAGRITALADVFDALTSARPHKSPRTFDESLRLISDNHNMLFDPEIVNVFVEHVDNVKEVYQRLAD
jgi:response regulator RpfG family c-di-GMP phosphodiesterase